jgi:hypothetical protein
MGQETKAKQLLDNALLVDLFEGYQAMQYERFKCAPTDELADIAAAGRASSRCLAYIHNKCREIIDNAK